jgi:hypothetical protein
MIKASFVIGGTLDADTNGLLAMPVSGECEVARRGKERGGDLHTKRTTMQSQGDQCGRLQPTSRTLDLNTLVTKVPLGTRNSVASLRESNTRDDCRVGNGRQHGTTTHETACTCDITPQTGRTDM